MVGPLLALVVTAIMVRYLLKKYQSQVVLAAAGLALLYASIIFLDATPQTILGKTKSTGLIWFDPIKFFTSTLAARAMGLGLMIMAASGYAKYMDKIGASRLLANTLVKPLLVLRAPYLVVGLSYLVGNFLHLFIPSASGLAMLLMVTMYPILLRLGVSPLSAAGLVATTSALDLGPASGNSNLAATQSGISIMDYFVSYQIPAGIAIMVVIAIAHIITQKTMDKRENWSITQEELDAKDAEAQQGKSVPFYYILLPLLPLVLLLVFSKFVITSITLDVPTAMFISGAIAILVECATRRSEIKEVFKDFMSFFDTMGTQFARVVSLIVAGETFARGLTATGAVDAIIAGAQSFSLGGSGLMVIMTLLIAVAAVIMGSGNAPFFAFAALAPKIAGDLGIQAVSLALPMQFVSSTARAMSPITAVVVATAGLANLDPFQLVKRTIPPMLAGIAANIVVSLIMF